MMPDDKLCIVFWCPKASMCKRYLFYAKRTDGEYCIMNFDPDDCEYFIPSDYGTE
jgi:hypothetical protein